MQELIKDISLYFILLTFAHSLALADVLRAEGEDPVGEAPAVPGVGEALPLEQLVVVAEEAEQLAHRRLAGLVLAEGHRQAGLAPVMTKG
jgi:hypothetical protein